MVEFPEIKLKQYENWKDICGFPSYQVSSLGRVRALGKYVNSHRGETKFKKFYKGRIKTKKIDGCGYCFTDLWINGKMKQFKIHRLVGEAFINHPDCFKQINHKDGNKLNNNVSNLEFVTAKENIHHAEINGLRYHPKGSECYNSKLTEAMVNDIRKSFRNKRGENKLYTEIYGVSPATITNIIKEKTWKHLL